ncbi:MAG: putative small rane protein [Glaciihabitans sp.]|jgi:hypothetical protein|nr:putative small rane protein [Glaciihabitans sp.]MCU1535505.1 putative small rane protein [Glaciihabitans sp.]
MNLVAFVVAFVLFVGGIVLFGFAFDVKGLEAPIFLAGIAAISVSLAIPFHLLKRTDR